MKRSQCTLQWLTLKSSPFELRSSDFYFENMFEVVRQFSSKWRANRWNPTKIDRLASFLKCEVLIKLLFGQFLSDFNDSHVILTRIVSRLWTYFQNKIRTIVARTATIFVWVIEVYTVTFSVGGGRCYYNGPQPAALGLIGPNWRHQNRLCSANVVHFARSNQT